MAAFGVGPIRELVAFGIGAIPQLPLRMDDLDSMSMVAITERGPEIAVNAVSVRATAAEDTATATASLASLVPPRPGRRIHQSTTTMMYPLSK